MGKQESAKRCATCDHYEAADLSRGSCIAHPPAVVLVPSQGVAGMTLQVQSAFPPIAASARCGDWKERTAESSGRLKFDPIQRMP